MANFSESRQNLFSMYIIPIKFVYSVHLRSNVEIFVEIFVKDRKKIKKLKMKNLETFPHFSINYYTFKPPVYIKRKLQRRAYLQLIDRRWRYTQRKIDEPWSRRGLGHASTELVSGSIQFGLDVNLRVPGISDQHTDLLRFEHHLKRLRVSLEANIPKCSLSTCSRIDRNVYLIGNDLQIAAWRCLERKHSLRVATVVQTDKCTMNVASFPWPRTHQIG